MKARSCCYADMNGNPSMCRRAGRAENFRHTIATRFHLAPLTHFADCSLRCFLLRASELPSAMNLRNVRIQPHSLLDTAPTGRFRIRRSILSKTIPPIGILLACAIGPVALGDAIFVPGDPILGGQLNTGTNVFSIGLAGNAAGQNNWPAAESPDHAIDGVAQKYLNFGITNTGFLVNPAFNAGAGSVVTSMQLWTANDAEPRDPTSYI